MVLTDVNITDQNFNEEKHGMDDDIILSSNENNRARPPRQCGVYLLASNNLKPSGVSWEARAESSIISQVSVITDIEQL